MIIYSFDCAIKNLGICIAQIDTEWQSAAIAATKLLDAANTIDGIHQALVLLNGVIDGIFKILFVNTISLCGTSKVKNVTDDDIMQRIKYVMHCLKDQMPAPDVVLIEKQMKINTRASNVSNFIQGYYTTIANHNTSFECAMSAFPLNKVSLPSQKHCTVHQVNASIKNAYQTDPTAAGAYSAFISKYSNYTANKKHATHNFKYFMIAGSMESKITGVKNKLDDVSDAFMMLFGWCKRARLF